MPEPRSDTAAPRQDYDIVIAGGGMVGASLALSLGELAAAGLRVLLVEKFPLPESSDAPQYRPSFDARSTALSYGSRLIYEGLGIWPQLREHACAIRRIHVSDRGHFGSVLMDPATLGWPELGYVIENAWLGNVLLAALRQRGQVDCLSPAEVVAAKLGSDAVELSLADASQPPLRARLLVIADGAASSLRERLGIGAASTSRTSATSWRSSRPSSKRATRSSSSSTTWTW